MTNATTAIPFYNSHWTTRWLIVGLALIALFRATPFLDRDWLLDVPWIVWLIIMGIIPELIMLLLPIFTRRPRGALYIPSRKRCLLEFGIATLALIASCVVLAGLEYLVDRLSPGSSFQPEAIRRLGETAPPIVLYPELICAFTLVPVAEEVFFRGFLFNAFRARMPLWLAVVLQSLIFGFGHMFGTLHAIGASLFGLFLGVVYQWRKTLVTPILIHAGMNAAVAISVFLTYLAYVNSPVLGVAGHPDDTTCIVRQVVPNSAAEKAGLHAGDVVVSFNGQPVRDFPQLAQMVRQYKADDAIPISVNRNGKSLTVTAVLQARDK
jgi:membrane protease YdiL (CAAX protease family)